MVAKHPKGLWILAFGEMWDRFSYYGIAFVMALYLTHVFLISDTTVYSIAGVYNTLGFGLPILGGLLADKFLGNQRAIMLGALLIILGNIVLIFNGLDSVFLGFSLVVVGVGLFKANITSQLGTLYPDQDKRKEGAFAIFYLGMNFGALMGPIIFGVAVAVWGWHAGFIFSAVGMCISLMLYFFNRHYLAEYLNEAHTAPHFKHVLFLIGLILVIALVSWIFTYPDLFGDFVWLFMICTVIAVIYAAVKRTGSDRRHIIAFSLFTIFSIFYFACARQSSTSLVLFINRVIDHSLFGYQIPTEWFGSLQPIFIIISLIVISPLWRYLGKINKQPSPMLLVSSGLFCGALSFVIFALSAYSHVQNGYNIPLYLLILGYFVLGFGELCIMPTVTAMVTDLAPKNLQSTFMGFWFLSSAFSAYVGATMAKLSAVDDFVQNTTVTNAIYGQAFLEIAGIVFVVMIISLITLPLMKRLIK